MKKLLLSVALLATINSFGQKLLTENFDGLNDGALTDQNDWKTAAVPTSLVVNGNGGKLLEIESVASSVVGPPLAVFFKNVGWANADTGNETLELSFDLFTGATTTNDGFSRFFITNNTSDEVAGFELDHSTKELSGLILAINPNYDPAETDNQSPNFYENISFTPNLGAVNSNGDNSELFLDDNSEYTLKLILDRNNSGVVYYIDGVEKLGQGTNLDFTTAVGTPTSFVGTVYQSESTNISYKLKVDNISVDATNRNTLSTNSVVASKFAVFPNPSNGSDFVNFTGDNIQATGATVFNLLGKEVLKVSQNELANKQINISTLAKGMYLLNIETPEGVATKKIIKN
jgi:hypothetical protein